MPRDMSESFWRGSCILPILVEYWSQNQVAVFLQHSQVPQKSDGKNPSSSLWKIDNWAYIGPWKPGNSMLIISFLFFASKINGARWFCCWPLARWMPKNWPRQWTVVFVGSKGQALCLKMPLRPLDLRQASKNANLKIKPGKKSMKCQQNLRIQRVHVDCFTHLLLFMWVISEVAASKKACFFLK